MAYEKPLSVDPTRYTQSEQVISAMSTTDEYFKEEKPEDPLVMIVEALLNTLPEDERLVVEMVIMARMSQHEAARTLGYINSSGKEDHKKVTRRLLWAMRKLRTTLNSPSFALAMAAHKLPVDLPEVKANDKLSDIIKNLEIELGDDVDEKEL